MDDGFHFVDLETVQNDAHDGLFGVGIPALCFDDGDAASENLGECGANVLGTGGDDICGFRAVQTVHDEVDGLEPHEIRDDGIKRKHPALEDDAAGDIEHDVIDHDEGADGEPQFLREDDRHDLDAIHRATETDRHAASRAGKQTAEERAEEEVRSCERGCDAHVNGEDIRDEPRGKGIDGDGVDRVDREDLALALQTV